MIIRLDFPLADIQLAPLLFSASTVLVQRELSLVMTLEFDLSGSLLSRPAVPAGQGKSLATNMMGDTRIRLLQKAIDNSIFTAQ